jgi:hypothetical protein
MSEKEKEVKEGEVEEGTTVIKVTKGMKQFIGICFAGCGCLTIIGIVVVVVILVLMAVSC